MNDANTTPVVSPPSPLTTRQRHGRALIRTAWGLEVIAAAIGLFIALATAFSTHTEILSGQSYIGPSDWLTIFIGALPFLMVAIVELMKIPLATAFYLSKPVVWRLIFLLSLLLLIVITFETMLNGFQRNFESRLYIITELNTKLTSVKGKIDESNRRIDDLQQITSEQVREEYSDDLQKVELSRNSDIEKIDQQIENQRLLIGAEADTLHGREIANLRERLNRLRSDEEQEISEYKSANKYNPDAIQKRRSELRNRIGELERQLQNSQQQREKELSDAIFSRGEINKRFDQRDANINRQKNRVENDLRELNEVKIRDNHQTRFNSGIGEIREKYRSSILPLENKLLELSEKIDQQKSRSVESSKERLSVLEKRRAEIDSSYQTQVKELQDRRQRRLQETELRESRISAIQEDIANYDKERGELRDSINRNAKDNQIYQIAALWYGKESPVDVTKDELKFISSVWFGSLAFIVAAMGTILALAGLVLRYHEPRAGEAASRGGAAVAFRSVRRAAVAYRRRLRARPLPSKVEIKEVMKEVPVDRVVFRDVPREVVVKELVYVPLYTSDPSLLNIDYGVGVVKPLDNRTESTREDRPAEPLE